MSGDRETLNESNRPLLSIIILNYNTGELLLKCVESVFNSSYENYEVIIVDNASKDESHIKCKQKFPEITLIENQENLGFCEGNNVGIKHAKGDFLIILNPDTEVKPNSFGELYKAFCKYGDGLYQPKLLSMDNKKRINTVGNMINLFGFGYSRGKGFEDRGQFESVKEICYASGACLFISKKTMEKIGLFDPFLFAYHDDLDVGWRAAQLGIKSYYIPTSIVYHAESFSFQWGPKKFYLLERNRWYCLLTHYSKSTYYKILPGIIITEIMIFFYFLSKGLIKEKIQSYGNILKNRKLIKEKYLELESKKIIRDNEIIKTFQDEMEIPEQVASFYSSNLFNKILGFLSRTSKSIL